MAVIVGKFQITPEDENRIEMPKGAIPLSVGVQRGQPYLWALIDTSAPKVKRLVYPIGTGHPAEHVRVGPGACFIGTFMLSEGSLVFHVFVGGEV